MTTLYTDVLVVGSGAGGAVTASALAAAGRSVMVVEEGSWVDPDALEPFSLEEMVAKYRHRGGSAALGSPPVTYAEGRCVGGSTEINSGLWHRLPPDLVEEWRRTYRIDEFSPETLDGYAERIERQLTVSLLPGAPPASSAMLERGASKLDWRAVEFARVFRYDEAGRGTKQTMARTLLPDAIEAGAELIPDCRVVKLLRQHDRVVGAQCQRRRPDGVDEPVTIAADHVFVVAAPSRPRPCCNAAAFAATSAGGSSCTQPSRSRPASPTPLTTATSRCTASPSSPPTSASVDRPAVVATSRWPWPTRASTSPTPCTTGRTWRCTTPPSAATPEDGCARFPACARRW
ncbi:MAG: GMC family oxidoreductase N-terminal domain-containing protein [Acidimicrobiales bacterium]